jgi:hypothetical protein
MLAVRVVASLVAGAALSLGPATAAGASGLTSPGIDITVTVSVPVVSVVIGPVPDKKHQDKPPKPKPGQHKRQKPPPVPAPTPVPAPPPIPAPVPTAGQQPPGAVHAPTRSAVVANGTTPPGAPAQTHAGSAPAGAPAVSPRPARALASDRQAESIATTVADQLVEPALPPPFQLGDISMWEYGAAFVLFVILGVGAWVMHLRGARW